MTIVAIKNMAAEERPRERMAALGVGTLTDAELLAILLGTGTRGRDVVQFARELLEHFNGVGGLLTASAEDLLQQPGVGPARVMQIQVIMELSRRYLSWHLQRCKFYC